MMNHAPTSDIPRTVMIHHALILTPTHEIAPWGKNTT